MNIMRTCHAKDWKGAVSSNLVRTNVINKACSSISEGALNIFWVRERAIWKGIDFLHIGISNGIDFYNFGIRNGTNFKDSGIRFKVPIWSFQKNLV